MSKLEQPDNLAGPSFDPAALQNAEHGEGLMEQPDPVLSELQVPNLSREALEAPTSKTVEPPSEKQNKDPKTTEEKLSLKEILSSSVEIIKVAFQGTKKLAWTRAALAVPTAIGGSVIGLLTGALIDSVSKNPDAVISEPKLALSALLGGMIGYGLARTGELIARHRFENNKVFNIDSHMRDGLRSQPPSTLISKEFQGKLGTVRGENWRIYEFSGKPMDAWTDTLQLGAALVTVGIVGPTALLPLAVAGTARAGAAWLDRREYDRMFNQLKDRYQVANNVWYQFLIPSALTEMVLTNKDQKMSDVGKKISQEIRDVQDRVNTHQALRHLAAEVVGYGALGVALWNCLKQVQAGTMSAGELSAVIVAAAQFSGATSGLIENTFGQLKSISIVKKFLEVCEKKSAPERSAEASAEIAEKLLSRDSGLEVKFENVSFAYPKSDEQAEASEKDTPPKQPFSLKSVSVTLPPGEIIGIAGQNGAGKSTLINLLLGLYQPQGKISVNGIDLADLDPRAEWLPKVGVLLQDHTLFTGLNIHDQIVSDCTKGFSPKRPNFTLPQVAEASGVSSEVAKITGGYEAIIGDNIGKGVKLSGGQKQKVALARALESRPDILILDEPTASLDATAAKELLPKIREFCAQNDYHPTILVVTHKMDLFPQCDRVLVMKDGEMKGNGTHSELIQDRGSIYHQLFTDYRNGEI